MSVADDMIHNAKEIRARLMRPPNSVPDRGINLKRKVETPPTPTIQTPKEVVLEYHLKISDLQGQIATLTEKIGQYEEYIRKEFGRVRISTIAEVVCEHYQVSITGVKGARRNVELIIPRHVICYLADRHTLLSYPQIGRYLGGRNHSTIIYSTRTIAERLLVDENLRTAVGEIEKTILVKSSGNLVNPTVAPEPEQDLAEPGESGLPESEVPSVAK